MLCTDVHVSIILYDYIYLCQSFLFVFYVNLPIYVTISLTAFFMFYVLVFTSLLAYFIAGNMDMYL